LAIYFCIDSIPDFTDPNFKFLADKGIKKIKTIKMRGVISQGLLGPLKWLSDRGHNITNFGEGDDITEQMGATKYVEPEEIIQYVGGQKTGSLLEKFPDYVRKTDEERLQNNLKMLDEIIGRKIIVSRKEDGCSCTFVHKDGKYKVCGRNYVLEKGDNGMHHYFFINEKYNIEDNMKKYGKNIAIQGEIVGPKINGNKLNLTEYDFRVFNIFDIDTQKYITHEEIVVVCNFMGLNTVPILYNGWVNSFVINDKSFEELYSESDNKNILKELLKYAEKIEYSPKNPAEGIVIKTNDYSKRCSFKLYQIYFC